MLGRRRERVLGARTSNPFMRPLGQLPGHPVHEVELPDEYLEMPPQELHEKIRTLYSRTFCRK